MVAVVGGACGGAFGGVAALVGEVCRGKCLLLALSLVSLTLSLASTEMDLALVVSVVSLHYQLGHRLQTHRNGQLRRLPRHVVSLALLSY